MYWRQCFQIIAFIFEYCSEYFPNRLVKVVSNVFSKCVLHMLADNFEYVSKYFPLMLMKMLRMC